MFDAILNLAEKVRNQRHLQWLVKLFIRTQTHHQSAFASQIAFFFFISLFPFITVFVTFAGGLIPIDSLTEVMSGWKTVPKEVKVLIITFVQTAKSQHLSILSLSFLAILWSTSRAYYALSHALNAAQGLDRAPNYWLARFKGLGYTLALSFVLTFAFLIATITPLLSKPIVSWFVGIVQLPNFYTALFLIGKWLFYMFVLALLILISYAFVPNKRQPLISLIPGVCVTVLGWWFETLLFNTFVLRFTRFSLIYGTLATVVIVLMWLYTLAGTLIFGAHVNALLLNDKKSGPMST